MDASSITHSKFVTEKNLIIHFKRMMNESKEIERDGEIEKGISQLDESNDNKSIKKAN